MNGLKFIRTRCNLSLSEVANVLGVSRQQVSAWENGVKPISENRLNQLEKYFGVEHKYFFEISEEDKEFLISKGLYRRQDTDKECYCFSKQGDMEKDLKFRPFSYPDFEESLDEQMIHAKKRKNATMEGIENVMGYFGKPDTIIEEITAINRGCTVYDALTTYLNKMPEENPGLRMQYYNMARNILFALLIANGLMSQEELEKSLEYEKGIFMCYDIQWINEQAENFKKKYDEKRKLDEEARLAMIEKRKNINSSKEQ